MEIAALIRGAGVRAVADVRSVPKSRAHPHVWAEAMALWVPDLAGASYEWRRELGGFRKPRPDSPNAGLRHPSFRGYADYMQTPPFAAALDSLINDSALRPTAIMCSETLWWRCHRRLIADFAEIARGVPVRHLMHDGRLAAHRPSPGVRLREDGLLVYDGGQEQLEWEQPDMR